MIPAWLPRATHQSLICANNTRHHDPLSRSVGWICRFILFHNKRHPAAMGAADIEAFLTHLAVDGHVAAATQNP
ncbi:MAG: phage integrase N-terminal SAM-like domain-containing protein [Anaerolinea sp.]|nr:phage integrase N-terminal SAM-like domain-containing protein [Anaerolinea sp.]